MLTFAYLFGICLAIHGVYVILFPNPNSNIIKLKRRLLSEAISDVKATKSRRQKIKILKSNMSPGLVAILRLNFDKKIILDVDLDIKYRERPVNDSIDSINRSSKTWNGLLITGNQTRRKKTLKFRDILEGLDPNEATLLLQAASRKLELGVTWFTLKRCFPKKFLGRL